MLRSGVASYSHLLLGCVVPALLLYAMPMRVTAADVPPACTPTVARIVSMQGVVELRRAGQRHWAAVTRLDTPVCQGDVVHAGPRSRAALVILPEKFVRLDQNSTVGISVEGDETLVEFFQDETTPRDACGAGYFITRFPRKFKVRTPFVNAAVEGTEFLVSMSCSATSVAVFEGKVTAETLLANAQRFVLNSGETISAGLGEPPAIKVLIKPADAVQWALYYPPLSLPGPGVGPDQQCEQSAPEARGRCLMVRAEQRLRIGRVDEAQADIDASLKLVPDNSDADALLSVINVAKNDKQRALALAEQATRLDPVNPRAWIALSYAQQASFKLEEALSSAQRAAELEPRSSIALTRVAELMMSLGKTRSALRAAQAAVDANPNDSRAHTILGFVRLAEIDIKRARADFEAAIAEDSSDPLPRLGLGLAIIRAGKLAEGREQIEIAVALDPTNSLLRSYVGKAYYEERTSERDKLASIQFGLAKQLDPKDPTPWFYDAILKQSQNQPVGALNDLQTSVALNENRGVYRSSALLGQDSAARSATIAQIYTQLGLTDRALLEAGEALSIDPTSPGAHSFLWEIYSSMPRTEIARDSESLQFRLRQPLSQVPLDPLRPQSSPLGSVRQSGFLAGVGPSRASLNEYSSIFEHNGAALYLDGLLADYQTAAEQVAITGLIDHVGLNAAQGHYETAGVTSNQDLHQNVGEGLVQVSMTDQFSLAADFFYGDVHRQTIQSAFDPTFATPLNVSEQSSRAWIGGRYGFAPNSELLFLGGYQESDARVGFPSGFQGTVKLEATGAELQYSFVDRLGYVIVGAGHTQANTYLGTGVSAIASYYDNAYLYTQLNVIPHLLRVQLGLSYDLLLREEEGFDRHEANPKFGLFFTPTTSTTVRLAAFQYVKRELIASQTLEPTQVGGFNQFYDDPNGAVVREQAIAFDQKFPGEVYAGIGLFKRNLEVPFLGGPSSVDFHWTEQAQNAYLYWALPRKLFAGVVRDLSASFTTEYHHLELQRPPELSDVNGVVTLDTTWIPIGLNAFLGERFSANITASFVDQTGVLQAFPGANQIPTNARFWNTDASVSLFFPRRLGLVKFGVANMFDRQTQYQEIDPTKPQFSPRRLAYASISVRF